MTEMSFHYLKYVYCIIKILHEHFFYNFYLVLFFKNYNVTQFHHSVPIFEKGPWCIAIDELINNKFNPDDYSIACIKSKESSHKLENHRTEILAGVIKSVDHNSHDPLITIKDPTGIC